ncbi:MAG TPA: helix-turn-helix domain-containing protein [Acidimicrobiia bacterium]|nr:helix-turn-helix domain-containing protein [Acidimicrobiia bacterium]
MTTRDKLLDAAARLFAARGIDDVSTAEVVRAAGQRNASAVHYHFGTRDNMLRELLARHVPAIAARRRELIEAAKATPDDDVRAAAEAVVRPITEFARMGWRERAYLQIGTQLTPWLARTTAPDFADLMEQTAGFDAWALLRDRCPRLPDDLWDERRDVCVAFVGRAAADRARSLDARDSRSKRRDRGGAPLLSDDRFVDNLVAMVVGAMTAPMP